MPSTKESRSSRRCTYWLLPAATFSKELNSQIRELSQAENVPAFQAHATIYAGALESEALTIDLLNTICSKREALSLRAVDVRASEVLTKSVFIQFEPSSVLSEICEFFRDSSSTPSKYQLNPHMSLLYSEAPLTRKKQIAIAEQLLFKDITFDEIRAYSMPAEFDTPGTVLEFDEICRARLGETE